MSVEKMETKKLENLRITTIITNFLSKEQGSLIPLDDRELISEADIKKIVSICDNSKTFDLLFAELDSFKGRRYEEKDAWYWVNEMGRRGWNILSNFIYIVRNSRGEIVCAIDIKSSNLETAEVGYWADENNSGWMTNTLIILKDIARNAGFKKLFGQVRKTNNESIGVMQRAGFIETEAPEDKKEHYKQFEISLV